MSNELTRQQAIKFLDRATDVGGKDDEWWIGIAEGLGLYDEKLDSWPTFQDVLIALGVSEAEIADSEME